VSVVEDIEPYAWILLVVGGVLTLAIASSRVSQWVRVPAPAFFLLGASLVASVSPTVSAPSITTVDRIVTVALVLILFDGGMHIGLRRIRTVLGSVLGLGIVGTLLTAAALAVAAHLLFGFGWVSALLLGTALAPTDPAVVFSVLGQREVQGRTGTLLEGESGANDPVGIALMISLLGLGGALDGSAAVSALETFVVQLLVGAAVGGVGGWLLSQAMQRLPLPGEGLYPLRTVALALGVYGAATVAGGSGFLAVFVAGIVIGDDRAPFQHEVRAFHTALASLAEVAAFVVLGLTVPFTDLFSRPVWLTGLVLAALLVFVVRPVLVGPLLLAVRLRWGERAFVLWSGLKGAVPVLLGTYVLTSGQVDDVLVFDVIFVVVAFSVIVQGSLVFPFARRWRVPMRALEPRPWTANLRFRDRPDLMRHHTVDDGSFAEGRRLDELAFGDGTAVSMVIRDGNPAVPSEATTLSAGDEVVVLTTDPAHDSDVAPQFDADTQTGS
jgi:cell volume regulation protein A